MLMTFEGHVGDVLEMLGRNLVEVLGGVVGRHFLFRFVSDDSMKLHGLV